MPRSFYSGSVSRDNCGQLFPDKLCVSRFPDRFAHYAWTTALSAHSDFVGSRVYAYLGITCYLNFWQSDRRLLCATVMTRVERTLNKNQHTKLTLEKNILPLLLPGFELTTFRPRVWRPYQKAIPAPVTDSNTALLINDCHHGSSNFTFPQPKAFRFIQLHFPRNLIGKRVSQTLN